MSEQKEKLIKDCIDYVGERNSIVNVAVEGVTSYILEQSKGGSDLVAGLAYAMNDLDLAIKELCKAVELNKNNEVK